MTILSLLMAASAVVGAAGQNVAPAATLLVAVETPAAPAPLVLPKGMLIRLMVTREVNSRDHSAGFRFPLRVDEAVTLDGVTLIPIGAKAWGEVVDSKGTGGAGKSGKLNARLLYIEAGNRRIPIEGSRQSAGTGGTGQVVAAVATMGPLGLFMKGNNASLKAGEIFNGYTVDDAPFDRSAGATKP